MRIRFLGLFLLAAATLAAAPLARADNNSVQFFSDLHIEAGKPAANAVCFFCNVEADGEIHENLVILFSNAHIHSAVHQNVVSLFSNVEALPGSSIEQNVVNIFSNLRLESGTHVGQNVVAIFGATDVASSAIIDGNRVLFPFWLFGIPAVLLGFLIYGIVHAVRERRYRAHMAAQYPYPPRA